MLFIIENGLLAQYIFGEFPEDVLIAIKESTSRIFCHTKVLLHIDVEVLQHLRTHFCHAFIYLLLHFALQLFKSLIDFFFATTLLVYFPDTRFYIKRICLPQHFVAGTKHIIEEFELSRE